MLTAVPMIVSLSRENAEHFDGFVVSASSPEYEYEIR
jgi:hypothetical protein